MCSKSNPLVVFALDLMSTYEGEHTIFGLLSQAKEKVFYKMSPNVYIPAENSQGRISQHNPYCPALQRHV
jgi:hypothetical protein